MTFEQKLATLIGAAIATTYWYRGQQITRHDHAAIKAADGSDFAAWEREVRR